jgi:hypothetical protein
MTTHLISPDELLQMVCETELNGREPISYMDWVIVINSIAYNTDIILAESVCQLMRVLYQMPLTEDQVFDIVAQQIGRRIVERMEE